MGHCGTTLYPLLFAVVCPFLWPLVGSFPGGAGKGWLDGWVFCSHAFPFEPGLQTQSWGLRHIPPFWHWGLQLATTQTQDIGEGEKKKRRDCECWILSDDRGTYKGTDMLVCKTPELWWVMVILTTNNIHRIYDREYSFRMEQTNYKSHPINPCLFCLDYFGSSNVFTRILQKIVSKMGKDGKLVK